MKKTIRIVLPILFAIAILICSAWYLYVYDRDFTRDMLLYSARHFDSTGNHSLSSWFYDQAYNQADDNDSVAIELAEQHKAAGNYTKAENTLSQAIADGASVELYTALSKTFVEQDKLLDAVAMLNNIANPEIKETLDSLRPSAPTCSPDPVSSGAYYTQYITVSIESDGGTLFVNTQGEFPSVQTDLYQDGITLVDGENTIYAVAVADNGLVSPVSIFGFTVGGVISKIDFVDSAIESEIRHLLSVPDSKILYSNDLWNIKEFTVPSNAKSLHDLNHLIFLEKLTISQSDVQDFSCLSSLTTLKELYITDTAISSDAFSLITNLQQMEKLVLKDCDLTSIAGLDRLVKLSHLDLSNNTIRNISPISKLTNLQELMLNHNALNELSALSSLNQLKNLQLSYNMVTSLSPIASLTNLKQLNADNNSITDLSALESLTTLMHLDLSFNSIEDVSVLSSHTNLQYLDISNNTITDIQMLSKLSNLMTFNFSNNQVSELPEWSSESSLVNIDGSYNLLESLEALSGLPFLNNVYMDYNEDIESVDCLASCPVLIQVNVFGTDVDDITSLTAQSIVVNYDPTNE